MLVALNVPAITEGLWKHVEQNVTELDIRRYVKVTDKEVAIFKTADGQLYNMEALDL